MKTILVCYEDRPVAGRMLERAAELAKLTGASIVVTSIAPTLHGRGGPIDPTDPPERHETEVQQAAEQLASLGVANVQTSVGFGDPAKGILHTAAEHGADLIVLGAHHGGTLSRVLSGNVGDTVAHHADADVLLVR